VVGYDLASLTGLQPSTLTYAERPDLLTTKTEPVGFNHSLDAAQIL